MAVSKALRGHADIGVETRQRVRERAAELGYRIDMVARSMITGRSFLVGLVVPDLMQSFFAEVASSLSAGLETSGYHVLISNTNEDAGREIDQIDILVSRKVDGLVIGSAQHDPALLAALKVPFVMIDRIVPGLEADYVGSDDQAIGALATRHLIDKGCRSIIHLAGPDSSTSKGRSSGFIMAMNGRNLGAWDGEIFPAGHDDAAGYETMRSLIESGARPDGVFCFNDPVAIGAMRAACETGLAIPDDVAIIGVANTRYADQLGVPLSSIDQGTAAIGRRAAELLLDAMAAPEGHEATATYLPARLIARASTDRSPA